MKTPGITFSTRQSGFTLVELMVALLIAVTVMSGVVQMLVVSKSNFIAARELATAQENARYAMKFIVDEVRMAGFTGCTSTPANYANSIRGSADRWYISSPGIQGFEHETGTSNFPDEFKADTAVNTDALVVRRSVATGLRLRNSPKHTATGANLALNRPHAYKRGQAMVITSPDCEQVGVFQISGPANNNNNAMNMIHNTGNAVPGNCDKFLGGTYHCSSSGTPSSTPEGISYPPGSAISELRSEAYYISPSTNDISVPALYRERMLLSGNTLSTSAEELVKGVENMQIFYGLDELGADGGTGQDGIADGYVKANAVLDWNNIVSVRLSLRMRSLLPVYNEPVAFGTFEGAAGTDGSDRFMRQDISTTITLRNP